MTPDERIAELQARLAMVVEALREALTWHIPTTQTIIHLQPSGKETIEVVRHGRRVKAEKALKATAPDLAAFLRRVERRGAAKELRDLAAELRRSAVEVPHPQNQHEWRVGYAESLEARAAELERK